MRTGHPISSNLTTSTIVGSGVTRVAGGTRNVVGNTTYIGSDGIARPTAGAVTSGVTTTRQPVTHSRVLTGSNYVGGHTVHGGRTTTNYPSLRRSISSRVGLQGLKTSTTHVAAARPVEHRRSISVRGSRFNGSDRTSFVNKGAVTGRTYLGQNAWGISQYA